MRAIAAADDPATTEIDGFTDGNAVSFKLWDAGDEIEITNVIPTYITGDGLFLQFGTAELYLEGYGNTQQTIDL